MTAARARAELYAKAAGMRVKRIVSISESGAEMPQPPRAGMIMVTAMRKNADTEIQAGDQKLGVTVQVSFELQ
jgi:uncharacterized protein YggE